MSERHTYSEEVKDGINRSEVVVTALTTHSLHLGQLLQALMETLISNGLPLVKWADCFLDLAHVLQGATDVMAEADLEHSRELSEDEAARLERDRVFPLSFSGTVAFRRAITGCYGKSFAERIGFTTRTSNYPPDLLRQLQDIRRKVKALDPWPPKERNLPAYPQAEALAMLDDLINPLDQAIADVLREVQESKASMLAKWKAMEQHDRVYQGVASAATGLAVLANEPDLAERLVPTAAKPPKKEGQEAEAPAEGELDEGEIDEDEAPAPSEVESP